MGDDYPEVPFSLALPEHTWHLLTPAERRVTALALNVTMLAASGALDMPDVAFSLGDLALLAELHARFTEGTA